MEVPLGVLLVNSKQSGQLPIKLHVHSKLEIKPEVTDYQWGRMSVMV